MSIIKIRDKRVGITYVYEQEKSVWDPIKKQPRSKRTLIGKLDENGDIVPTNNWGKNRKFSSSNERDYKKRTVKKGLCGAETGVGATEKQVTAMKKYQRYIKRALRLTYESNTEVHYNPYTPIL